MRATKICVTLLILLIFSGITGTKTSIVVVFISSVLFNIPRFFQWYSDSIPCAAGSKLYFRSPGALQSSDNVARKQVRVRLSVCLSVSLKTGACSSVCLLSLSVCRSVSVMWQLPMMLLVGQRLCGAPLLSLRTTPRYIQTCSLWNTDCRQVGGWHSTECCLSFFRTECMFFYLSVCSFTYPWPFTIPSWSRFLSVSSSDRLLS